MPVNQLATVNQLNKQLISPALHLIKLKSSMFDVYCGNLHSQCTQLHLDVHNVFYYTI